MDGPEFSADGARDAVAAALRPVPRPERPPVAHFCRACGEEIEPERRRALPGTRFCRACNEEQEAV